MKSFSELPFSSAVLLVHHRLVQANPTLHKHLFDLMDFAMEDNQNSAPGSVQAAKLNAARKGPDSQSVTKR